MARSRERNDEISYSSKGDDVKRKKEKEVLEKKETPKKPRARDGKRKRCREKRCEEQETATERDVTQRSCHLNPVLHRSCKRPVGIEPLKLLPTACPATTCMQVFCSWRTGCAQLPMMRLRQNVHAGFQLPPIRQQNVEAALVAAYGGTWCSSS